MPLPHKRRAILRLAAGAATVLAAPTVLRDARADGWPSRPVRFIVPFPQGQATDTVSRIVVPHLATQWKQEVTVENRPGGSGIPAMVAGKDAAPDGYVLTVGTSGTLVINPALFPSLPYRPLVDFAPVSTLFTVPLVVACHPVLPARSFSEFITLVRREPGKHRYGMTNQGSTQHLAMELLKARFGLDMPHVSLGGSAATVSALVAGGVHVVMETAAALMPAIRANKITPVAVTTARRAAPPLDFIPPVADTLAGFDVAGWGGIVAPIGTPPEIVMRIAIDVQSVLREPAVVRELGDKGTVPAAGTSAEFSGLIRKELEIWAQVVRATGVKPS